MTSCSDLDGTSSARNSRSDAAAANGSTHSAAVARPAIDAASPIISSSDANAANQVSAASASQPLRPVSSANTAALK